MLRGGKILQDRETKILSSKMNAEIETAHDDIAKLWKSISDLERLNFMTSDNYILNLLQYCLNNIFYLIRTFRKLQKKSIEPNEDPSSVGALAAAINSQMKKKTVDLTRSESNRAMATTLI